jgi:hypothetical protein
MIVLLYNNNNNNNNYDIKNEGNRHQPVYPHHFFAPTPSYDLGNPTTYIMVFCMLNNLRYEVIVCFVDFGGIVHYHFYIFIQYVKRLIPRTPSQSFKLIIIRYCNLFYAK